MNRIRETCTLGLLNWYKANMKEVSHTWYTDHPRLKNFVLEEAEFIAEVLKTRDDYQHTLNNH